MSSFDAFTAMVIRQMAEMQAEIRALRRWQINLVREARVLEVDYEKGLAEVEANGLPSQMMPWVQRAGTQREWDPPTKDERVLMISPSGDPGQGLILPGGYSDKYKQPHKKGGERYYDIGDTSQLLTKDTIHYKSKKFIFEVNDNNKITLDGNGLDLRGD